ncbi:MAG: NADPH-dependent oxidoreductase [Spirochaeta sp.]|jgi:nitroreductase|nr:NADPH-dependent oxidoreductase [Spirochaeta sp.]
MDDTVDTVMEVLRGHASCRRYATDPIDDAPIREIVGAAQRAATSSNLQLWSAIVIRNPATRSRLAELCGGQPHIEAAPVFIAWLADRSRLDRAAELRGYSQDTSTLESFLVAAVDTAVAMQNATVAAEAMGLGTCYIGGLRNDTAAVIELLGLPEHVFPIAGMTLGVPARPSRRTKPRLSLDGVLHCETFTPVDDQTLFDYDEIMRATGIYRDRHQPGTRPDGSAAEQIADDEYGWLEHSARRVSAPQRPNLSEQVRRQGYRLA